MWIAPRVSEQTGQGQIASGRRNKSSAGKTDVELVKTAGRSTGAAAFAARQAAGSGRRIGLGLAISAVVLGLGATGLVLGSGAPAAESETRKASAEPTSTEAAERQVAARAAEAAELDRRRESQSREIAENRKRIEDLQKRRDALEREVAALTAPLVDPGEPKAIEPAIIEGSAAPVDRPASPMPRKRERVAPERIETADIPVDAAVVRTPGAVRVFIHVRFGDRQARLRAQALADDLRNRGVEVAGIRGVPRAVRGDLVRFYYDADRRAVPTLESALEASSGGGTARTQDFRARRIAPKPGTLEIWLS